MDKSCQCILWIVFYYVWYICTIVNGTIQVVMSFLLITCSNKDNNSSLKTHNCGYTMCIIHGYQLASPLEPLPQLSMCNVREMHTLKWAWLHV